MVCRRLRTFSRLKNNFILIFPLYFSNKMFIQLATSFLSQQCNLFATLVKSNMLCFNCHLGIPLDFKWIPFSAIFFFIVVLIWNFFPLLLRIVSLIVNNEVLIPLKQKIWKCYLNLYKFILFFVQFLISEFFFLLQS